MKKKEEFEIKIKVEFDHEKDEARPCIEVSENTTVTNLLTIMEEVLIQVKGLLADHVQSNGVSIEEIADLVSKPFHEVEKELEKHVKKDVVRVIKGEI